MDRFTALFITRCSARPRWRGRAGAGGRDVIIMRVINIIIQMSLGCYNLVIRWSRQSTPDHSPHTARKKDLLSTYGVYATHITHCHVSYISNSISVDIHVKNL